MSTRTTPSFDTPTTSLQQLHEARLQWKQSKTNKLANELELRKIYRQAEWKYFDESLRVDKQTKSCSLNIKHMSDDFMERHFKVLLENYKKDYSKVCVIADRYTIKYVKEISRIEVVEK